MHRRALWWKIFNKRNALLNHSLLGYKFGNVGFPSMDDAQDLMGAAMVHVANDGRDGVGCFALFTSEGIVMATYWAQLTLVNSADESIMQAYVGLRSMVLVTEGGGALSSETVLFSDDDEGQ